MAETDKYARTEYDLTATFGAGSSAIEFRDIVSLSATFGLNSIPTASLVVATGWEVRTGKPATIHDAYKKLTARMPVKVVLEITTNDGKRSKMMPDGKYTVFEGFYCGIGYQRSNTNSSYTLHLVHWLDDMNCSSMLNGNWTPGMPGDLAAAAGNFAATTSGGADVKYAHAGAQIDPLAKIINLPNVQKDFWEKCLKPVFTNVSKFRHPQDGQNDPSNGADPNQMGTNARALEALKKMPGESPNKVPLQLKVPAATSVEINYNLNAGLSRMCTEGIGYTSFWGKLVGEIAPSFCFAVSPSATFANVIPFFGGLRKEWKTIHGDEYNYANFNANTGTVLESVNIYYGAASSANAGDGGVGVIDMSYFRPWGSFPKFGKKWAGNILIKEAPAWLTNAIPAGPFAAGTTGIGGEPPIGSTADPGSGKGTPSGGAKRSEPALKSYDLIVDLFAEHWFKNEVLSQRYGELSGKFRLDIAPGSIVKILTPDDPIESLELPMFASVTQVSFVINAEQHAAGTSFTLSNLRSEDENKDQLYTSDKPPLFEQGWSGCDLAIKQ